MPTPVLIGPDTPLTTISSVAAVGDITALAGPFLSGNGNYYQIVCINDRATGNIDIGLAKSTDGGNTYPTIIAGSLTTLGAPSVWYPETGEVITLLYPVSTGPSAFDFYTVEVTMNTETFGTPNHTPLSHISASNSPLDWQIVVNGAGEQVVFYDIRNNTNTAADVWAIRFTSGAWSSPIQQSNQTLSYLDQVLVDGNGDTRCLWSDWQAGGPTANVKRNAMYETRMTGGTVAATYTCFSDATEVNNKGYGDHNVKEGIYDAFHEALIWPICKQTLSGSVITSFEVGTLICSNANSFPSYTYERAWSAAAPDYVIGWPALANKAVGHELSLLWAEDARPDDHLPNGLTLRRVTSSAIHGVWSVLTTFYDPAVDPPAPTISWISSVMFFTWTRYVGPSEAFAANVDFVVTSSGGAFSPFNFPIESAPSPTLACPVSNTFTVGVPYSGSLIESGGTAPFTYAIIGGALPPGLSLNATTGVISGTPTSAGDFSYTAQVTDANGLTATVGCMLSGSGVQPTTPCGQSVPVPSTDVKFELRRVYASMKPAPRLPVRGS